MSPNRTCVRKNNNYSVLFPEACRKRGEGLYMKQKGFVWIVVLLIAALLLAAADGFLTIGSLRRDAPEPTPVVSESPEPTPTTTPTPTPEPADDELVVVKDVIPSIRVELRYATTENCTGTVIYDSSDAMLRYGTVKKLARVQEALLEQGYSLKIWDAFRPIAAQFRLWEVCPDNTYIANPNTGCSDHSRGNTVDITLVRADGTEIPMPSGFDEFSALADRDFSDVSPEAGQNAALLDAAMTAEGFVGYIGEWWHYSDSVRYDVVTDT